MENGNFLPQVLPQAMPQEEKSSTGKKVVLWGLGLVATGALGYFGWKWWKGRDEASGLKVEPADEKETPPSYSPPPKNNFLPPPSAPKRNDEFPLKNGSKGSRVSQLQTYLNEKFKAGLRVDGDFGTKTQAALAKAGLPGSIDESTFNVLFNASSSASFDAGAIAKELNTAAKAKNIAGVKAGLAKLKSTDDYSAVSEVIKHSYEFDGVSKTLVNAMLDSFSAEKDKNDIRLAFTRMGLKYDGKIFSLSGLDTSTIITRQATLVWVNPKTAIKVPKNMVLGKELEERNGYTLFEQNGRNFLVETKTISYI